MITMVWYSTYNCTVTLSVSPKNGCKNPGSWSAPNFETMVQKNRLKHGTVLLTVQATSGSTVSIRKTLKMKFTFILRPDVHFVQHLST
jgi:hypothetical protein